MSTTIDRQVVEMKFDNKHFENNVQTSLSTLQKLKQSLNMDGASKSLVEVDRAAKKLDFSGLGHAVETVQAKFSALQVIGITALTNITNSAINAGKRIASALTIDPIKMGFQEYETQINAVQTILANTESKGTTLKDVNSALDELNTYADKTIYNFTEMTRNIGTFTAAGVDLDTSVSAIKGIANLAAVSGSTSQQASTAMYQLSQALSSGTVKLMDWNSVVNAGMGGQVFQDALKETARVHGIAIDEMIKRDGSFRETLHTGWLSAEILTETLSKFTGDLSEEQLKSMGYTEEQIAGIVKLGNTANDAATKVKTFTQLFDTLKEAAQSGWTQSWETIVGDFEEAKELLTEISDTVGAIIGASAERRNNLLLGWKEMGGRKDMIDSFRNIFEAIGKVITPIKDAFREIFPPTTAEQLHSLTAGLKSFTEKLKISDTTADNLKRTFKGVFALFDIGVSAVKALFRGFADLVGFVAPAGNGILGLTASIGDFIVGLRDGVKASDIFNTSVEKIVGVIKIVVGSVMDFAESIRDLFSGIANIDTSGAESFIDRVKARFEPLAFIGNGIKALFLGLAGIVKSVAPIFFAVASKIGEAFRAIQEGLASIVSDGDYNKLFDIFNSGIFAAIGIGIAKFVNGSSGLFDGVKGILDDATGFVGQIKDIFGGVSDALGAFTQSLQADTLKKIAIAIAILSASLLVLSFIDSEKLTESLAAITVLFADLMGAMTIFGKLDASGTGVVKAATTMISMSVAVLILASAMKVLSSLDWDGVAKGLLGVAGLTAIVVAAAKILSSGEKRLAKGMTSLIVLALALKVLASVCKDLSTLSWEELGKGLTGVGVLLAEIALFLNLAKFNNKSVSTAAGILILSAALKVLASVCEDFGSMSWGSIGKGLAGIGALLLEVAVFTKLTGNAKHVVSTALSLVLIGAAMKILASAIATMGDMSWEQIGKGLLTMAGALAAVTLAVNLMPKNMLAKSIGLIGIATALVILSSALRSMGSMSWEEIGKGLVALAGSMTVIALAMMLMKSAIPGALALTVITTSLALFVPILKALGSMSIESIAKSLITLAGVFLIIGVAGYALAPVVGVIFKLTGAIALLGVGCLAMGAGVVMLSAGIAALGASLGALGGGVVLFVAEILGVFPVILKMVEAFIVSFFEAIAGSATVIIEAARVIIVALVKALVECVPLIAEGVLKMIDSLLKSLKQYTPSIVSSLFDFVIELIYALADRLPDLIKAGVDLVMALFVGVVDALKDIDPKALIEGIAAVGLMAGVISALSAISAMIPSAMVGVLGMGAIMAELALVFAALGAFSDMGNLRSLIEDGGNLMEAIGTAIGQFIGGIAGGIAKGISSSLPEIGTDLSDFMKNVQPFIDGIKLVDNSVLSGTNALVGAMLAITGANLLEGIVSFLTGGSSFAEFGEEIAEFGPCIKKFADSVSGIDNSSVESAANAARVLTELASNVPNSGGMVSWFVGENSIAQFGDELISLGEGLKGFANEVAGIDADAIKAAANAGKSLAKMASIIPNEGGMVSWFAGDNSIAQFGDELISLGEGLKGFADTVQGIDAAGMTSAVEAATHLVEMTDKIPNSGGMVSWFSGDNSVANFGKELTQLGDGLKGFADRVAGVDPEAIVAASNAAGAIAEMTTHIPNSGGMVSWFTGDNSVAQFGSDLIALGTGLKGFATEVMGVNPVAIVAASNAAKALADMSNHIPNSGGVVSWFAGDNSVAAFGNDLIALGTGLKHFSIEVNGVNPQAIVSAASAAKSLAELSNYLPNEGGMVSWFTGDNSLSKFGGDLIALGTGLKGFASEVDGVNPEAISAAANAAKALAEMSTYVPDSGGMVTWFTGDNSLSKFGGDLTALGTGLKGFSTEVDGVNPEAIMAAANAAKALAEMTSIIPNSGGMGAWFVGEQSVSKFGNDLIALGKGLKGFASEVIGINSASMTAAASAAASLAQLVSVVPNEGGMAAWFVGEKSIAKFGGELVALGRGLKGFADEVAGIDSASVTAAAAAAASLAELADNVPEQGWDSIFGGSDLEKFAADLVDLGTGLVEFSNRISSIKNIEMVSSAISVARAVASMTKSLPEDTSFLADYGSNLALFGSSVKFYFGHMEAVTSAQIVAAKIAMNQVRWVIDNITANDLAHLDAITATSLSLVRMFEQTKKINESDALGFTAALKKLGETSFDAFVWGFEGLEADKKMVTCGRNAIAMFISGVDSTVGFPEEAFYRVISNCVTAIRSKVSSFMMAGMDVVTGFASGITANTWMAAAKARAMAAAAIEAAKEELKEHSPSKVFYGIGDYAGIAFVNALAESANKAYDAGSDIARSSVDGLNNAISKIAALINGDIDIQPTIRPILDLSDVKSGASAISGMLSGNGTISVDSRAVGSISAMMSGRSINGSDELISTMKALRKDIANMPREQYNFNGITYDDGSNIADAVKTLVRAAKVERRT